MKLGERVDCKLAHLNFRRKSILILRGDRAPKKSDFLVEIFRKMPKNAFFGLFFQKLARGEENFVKLGSL